MEIKVLNSIRFLNVGEDPPKPPPGSGWDGRRQWNACREYNFLSAGQGPKYSRPLLNIAEDDIIIAYITGQGYVGIGEVFSRAIPIKDFAFMGRKMASLGIEREYITGQRVDRATVEGLPFLRKTIFRNADNENSEYVIGVKWLCDRNKADAYWEKGLFAYRGIQCTMGKHHKTLAALEKEFNVQFNRAATGRGYLN